MKFLFITHIFPPAVDGGSKIIAKLEEYFRLQGHQTQVLTTPHYSTDDFINSHASKIQEPPSNIFRLPIYHLHRRLPKPIFKIFPFVRFLFTIFKFHPDFIIAGPLPTTIVIYARIIRLITRAKLILVPCFHENDADFRTPVLLNTLKSADLVCTLTHYESDHLESRIKCQKSRLFVMGAGVDKSFLIHKSYIVNRPSSLEDKSNNVLFLGNFAAHKGIETLINAIEKLNHISLTIVGQKTLYFPKIEQKINSSSAKIKVIPKRYDTTDLKHYLDSCSLLVLPSTQESFGLVLIEAMARGKPVISADIPPVRELITNTQGGLVFKPNNSTDLAKKISAIIKNLQKYRSSYQYVKNHFTWDKIGDSLWQKISSL